MGRKVIDASDLWAEIMALPHNGDMISAEEVEQAIKEAPPVEGVCLLEWNRIEEKQPEDYEPVLGMLEEQYGFQQVRECYMTGRTPWAYFPTLQGQYRITKWARVPMPGGGTE